MKQFVNLLVTVAVSFGLAWLLSINPAKEYGWFMGLIHGGFLVPNWIISWFDPDWLVKAPLHTTMYNVDWWISVIFSAIFWSLSLLLFFIGMFKRK